MSTIFYMSATGLECVLMIRAQSVGFTEGGWPAHEK